MSTDRAAILFKNNATETAPAGCVLEPDGSVTTSGQLGVTKPTSKSAGSTAVLINGPVPVPAGGAGQCWSPYPLATVALDTADVPLTGTPVALGVVAGDWHLRKAGSGFLAVVPDAGGYTTVVPNGGENGKWVKITSGTDATGYAGTRQAQTAPGTWADYPAGTPEAFTTGKIRRAPSNTVSGPGGPPDLQIGDVVEVVPSLTQPGYWETDGSSLQEVEIQYPDSWQINTGTPCTITVATTKTLRITGRDLKADVV